MISSAIKALDLKLFASEESLSPAITAIKTNGFDAEAFRKSILETYGIQLAGGQDNLKGKIFRVGHLGYVSDQDIISAITAIAISLYEKNMISQNQIGLALIEARKNLNK